MNEKRRVEGNRFDVIGHWRHPERGIYAVIETDDEEVYVKLNEDEAEKIARQIFAMLCLEINEDDLK